MSDCSGKSVQVRGTLCVNLLECYEGARATRGITHGDFSVSLTHRAICPPVPNQTPGVVSHLFKEPGGDATLPNGDGQSTTKRRDSGRA
jgi:hypothetical protein